MSKNSQRALEILDILQHFKFHPHVSAKALQQYCERSGHEFLGEGEYQDHLFQYNHDQKSMRIIPLILQAMTKYQYIPDYTSEARKAELKKANEEIEFAIIELCSANDLQYREIDILIKNFAEDIGSTINNAGTRMNNMCARVVATVAQDTFGESMFIKDLSKFHDDRAKGLSTGG